MSEPLNGRYPLSEKTSQTDDERIVDVTPLPPPEHLIRFFPIRGTAVEKLVADTRERIRQIMSGGDDRLLVIIGPCSIHDPAAALEYAARLKALREQHADTLEIVMRVYFEKPRTTVGWKGLINDPYLDESYRIDEGLRMARQLLLEINRLGMPPHLPPPTIPTPPATPASPHSRPAPPPPPTPPPPPLARLPLKPS